MNNDSHPAPQEIPKRDLISRQEAEQILARGHPTEEELVRFPLGDVLKLIPKVDPRYGTQRDKDGKEISDKDGKKIPGHIQRVFNGLDLLLSNTPNAIVQDWAQMPFQLAAFFEQTFTTIFGDPNNVAAGRYCKFNTKKERDSFFRILALYHDIGKATIVERHPLVGWHLINDVNKEAVQKELYPFLLGHDYSEWQAALNSQKPVEEITTPQELRCLRLFEHVVRYHDYFGILGTGEGSLPVMVDLVGLRGADPAEAKELFSILMVFALADLYGSVPKIRPELVKAYCDDWAILCKAIDHANGDRGDFFELLRKESQSPEATIRRLARLMYAGATKTPKWQTALNEERVEKVFREATLGRLYPFITNFAMFCKLDYCLAFAMTLMEIAENLKCDVEVPINAILTLFADLERGYGDLCRRGDGSWRRLGFEMAGLTRKPRTQEEVKESKIGQTIAGLLLDPGGKGKEWALRECTMWFMEE